MTEGPSETSPSPVPAFRMAFALVGLVVFGAISLVGGTLLFSGGYTSTIHCDRAGGVGLCKVEIPRHTAEVALDQGVRFESVHETSSRQLSDSQMLWMASHAEGQPDRREFICAVGAGTSGVAQLDALAADANRFVKGDARMALDLRCEGRAATVGNSLLLTGFSLIMAIASVITLVRGVRQMRLPQAG